MRKLVIMIVVVTAMGAMLTACGSSGSEKSKTASASVTQKTESAVQSAPAETETPAKTEAPAPTEAPAAEPSKETAAPEQPAPAEEAKEEVSPETPEPETEEETPVPEEGPAGTEEAEPAENGVHPYEIQGLQDMPRCNYLDLLCSYHYIRVYDAYVMGLVTEQTEAVDGVNTFTENSNTRAYSVDGHILSINDNAKNYMETDMSGMIETAKKNLAAAMENGTAVNGRVFHEKGSGTIPAYEDSGDTAEYEYYEYITDGSTDNQTLILTERFYMKDGDVFAISKSTTVGENTVEQTEVIKSISGDIPEGTFDIPDLTGYEEL